MRGCRGRRKEPYKKAGGTPKGFFFSPCNKSVIFYNTAFFNLKVRNNLYAAELPKEPTAETAN